MPILNFNLSYLASTVTQVICLYDALGSPFQTRSDGYGNYTILQGADILRDTSVASAGFPSSPNTFGGTTVTPLPANSFIIQNPQLVYGTTVGTTTSSVLQVNSVLANIEPGFSRLRVDYIDNTATAQTDYFDCPFYEGWDVTAQELNNIVRYMESAVNTLQQEVSLLQAELNGLLQHDLWRGITVSGQLQWAPATAGLVNGALSSGEFAHSMELPKSAGGTPNFGAWRSGDQGVNPADLYAAVTIPGTGNLGRTPTGNCYWAAFDNTSNYKGSWILSENTDGTITSIAFDTNVFSAVTAVLIWMQFGQTGQADASMVDSATHGNITVLAGNSDSNPEPNTPTAALHDIVQIAGHGNVAALRYVFRPTVPAGTVLFLSGIPGQVNYSSGTIASIGGDTTWYNPDGTPNNGAGFIYQSVAPASANISSVSPNTGVCAGSTVTLTGSNFDNSYNVYLNDYNHAATNISVVNSSTITFTVPVGITPGNVTVILQNSSYTVTGTFILNASPNITTVSDTTTQQPVNSGGVGETIVISGSGFGASGTVIFTDPSGTQYSVTASSYNDSQITCTVPNLPSKGVYNLTVSSGCGSSTIQFTCTHITPMGAQPIIIIYPAVVNLYQQQAQNFIAYLIRQEQAPLNITNQVTWSVNGTPGGDSTDGTISSQGLYIAPTTVSSPVAKAVTCAYTYVPVPDDGWGGNYTGGSTVDLIVPSVTSIAYAQLSVASQINVFLGDGRAGYVAVGTTLQAYPGQYVFVQFGEHLDPTTHLPIASNTDIQQLTLQAKTALDFDIANTIYNLTPIGIDPNTGNIITKRTVVLGIIDPSDGNWHSMWDIGLPPPTPANEFSLTWEHSLPQAKYFGNTLPAFKGENEFTGSVIDYIDNLSSAHQGQISNLNKRSNMLVTGNCYFDEKTREFSLLDQLLVFLPDEENRYRVLVNLEPQTIVVPRNQMLFIEDGELKTSVFGKEISPNTVVLGVLIDRFYTKWPILPQYLIVLSEE